MADYLVVLDSDKMGNGNDEIGEILIKAFLSALEDEEKLPQEILLYNTGVLLVKEGADTVEAFQELVEKGVSVKACGTCLSFFEMENQLAVGKPSNMRYILGQMRSYDRVVQP